MLLFLAIVLVCVTGVRFIHALRAKPRICEEAIPMHARFIVDRDGDQFITTADKLQPGDFVLSMDGYLNGRWQEVTEVTEVNSRADAGAKELERMVGLE